MAAPDCAVFESASVAVEAVVAAEVPDEELDVEEAAPVEDAPVDVEDEPLPEAAPARSSIRVRKSSSICFSRSLSEDEVEVELVEAEAELVACAEGGGPGGGAGGGLPSLPEPEVDPEAPFDNWLSRAARVCEIETPLAPVAAEVELVACVAVALPEELLDEEEFVALAAF